MIITLKKSVNWNGVEVTEIDLNLDALTGKDLLDAEQSCALLQPMSNAMTPIKEFDKGYLAAVAAKACGQPVDLIHALGAKDFTAVTMQVQGFLLESE